METNVRLLWISWVLLAPFLWFTMLARRTFLVPRSGGLGMMLGGFSMISGFAIAMWAGQHGSYSPIRWAAGVAAAICSVLLYEWARRTVTGRGFCSVLSGEVPQAVCTQGPYQYMRHPVYTSYLLAFLAVLIAFPAQESGLVFVANFAFFLYAATDEERTIAYSPIGPAYASYRHVAGMFFPRFGL